MTQGFRQAVRAALLSALLVAPAAFYAGAPAAAQNHGERERAEEMAREGMERFMRALELFMDSIPQYEMPEVTEDGDIIIRRKRPSERDRPPPLEPELESTRT